MTESSFRVLLQTVGRKSGRPHTVKITAVLYKGAYYFTRHHPDSDWFLNAAHNENVSISFQDGTIVRGLAQRVNDDTIISTISNMKYPNQSRAKERRVAIRVTPE